MRGVRWEKGGGGSRVDRGVICPAEFAEREGILREHDWEAVIEIRGKGWRQNHSG